MSDPGTGTGTGTEGSFCGMAVNKEEKGKVGIQGKKNGAGDRVRTDDIHLGKVVLYQLSYTRFKRY